MQSCRFVRTLASAGLIAVVAIGGLITSGIAQDNLASTREAPSRQRHFVILDQDGYGTNDCLEKQGGCGKIIADSFCESKGFKVSESHRRADADDVTGSITTEKPASKRETKAFVISCK